MVLCKQEKRRFPIKKKCFLEYLRNKVIFEVILRGRKEGRGKRMHA